MADQPPKRRRASAAGSPRYIRMCDQPHCYVHWCTDPDHPGSWIPDDACADCGGENGNHAQHCPKKPGLKKPDVQVAKPLPPNVNAKYREPYGKFGYPPAKEKPVCSSPNVLSPDDLRLIREVVNGAVKHAQVPDPTERAKEREHEAAMHRRECEGSERRSGEWCDVVNGVRREVFPIVGVLAAASTICFLAWRISVVNMPIPPAKPTPSAEQMFGMGGK